MAITQFLIGGIILGSLYAMVAIGFAVIFGTTRTFHFAHGAIYLWVGYATYYILEILRWNLGVAILVSAVIAVVLGVGIEQLIYQPLRERQGSPLAIFVASLGLLIFLQNLISALFGAQARPIVLPDLGPRVTIGTVVVTRIGLLQFAFAIVLLLSFLALFKWTTIGRSLRAVASNQEMAAVIGVDVRRVYILAFTLGSLALVPAALLNSATTGLEPGIGQTIMLMTMLSVIVGGVGSLTGAVLGGFLIGIAQSLAVWVLPSAWQNGIAFSLMMIFIVVRPTGILGTKLWKTGV